VEQGFRRVKATRVPVVELHTRWKFLKCQVLWGIPQMDTL